MRYSQLAHDDHVLVNHDLESACTVWTYQETRGTGRNQAWIMDEDEFDAYDIEFDVEHLPYIAELPPSPPNTPPRPDADDAAAAPQVLQRGESPLSEFAEYDLSEFTAEDLDAFDPPHVQRSENTSGTHGQAVCKGPSTASTKLPVKQENVHYATWGASSSRTLPHRPSGGPAINIELEQPVSAGSAEDAATASSVLSDFAKPISKADGKRPVVAHGAPPVPDRPRQSLYESFRSRTAALAVTDIVSPTW